ncbi:hypothetical protein AAFF_G00250010 [Aldrovandia affinis]|uniref:Uncharacterized protein n=1 Tax=Aldrovandia affinis TaxID=143900 RepID=A0AAD7RD59_9TELE|nr:hypothetical protein AAFF_G00250010 [Aldrovandia affinis]
MPNKKRADMVKTGGGPKTPELTPTEELALQQNRGRPIMEGIAGGSSSEQAGSSARSPSVKAAGHSVTLLQPPPIVLVRGEEPTDEASPEPGPSHSAGIGDGENESESQGDVRTLYKRYLRAEIASRQLKMRKLHKDIALLDRQLDLVRSARPSGLAPGHLQD